MQYHNRVTTNLSQSWSRCSRVELQGEHLVYVLDPDSRYDLLDNRVERHIRFLNLRTDEDLVGFVRAWGPLMLGDFTLRAKEADGIGREPCSRYWAFQSKLTAEMRLVQSLKSSDVGPLRAALLNYIAAEDDWSSTLLQHKNTSKASELNLLFTGHRDGNPEDWMTKADISRLRHVAAWCTPDFSLKFTLSAEWQGRTPHLVWEPSIHTLLQSIEWELWNSFTVARPVTICEECRTFFVPDSAHQRKFCSPRCAHRVAMRMWRKDNREGKTKRNRGKHAQAKKA